MATVLIVDDEAAISDLLADVLGELGYSAVTATNGREALDLIASMPEKPSLVLSDVMMPHLNGVDFVRALRARPAFKGVPLVLMTAAPQAVSEGDADAIMVKPFDLDKVLAVIQELLPAPAKDEGNQ